MQVFVVPSEGALKDCMEVGQAGVSGHEQSPPHRRAHAMEHHAKLINRRGRYRGFRHAGSLPAPTGLLLSLTPGISCSPVEGSAVFTANKILAKTERFR